MWIKNITIENCRLLKNISLDLSPDLNLIVGPNASGKTSLLESLHILSTGRSFRTSHIDEVISQNMTSILVAASVVDIKKDNEIISQIGIEKSHKKTKIRINKQDIYSQAQLSSYLPITVIHPNSIDLITGSPSIRRSFIDWIAFYIFPEFHELWKKYQHILKQRNICLKYSKHAYSLDKWTEELIEVQPKLISYRQEVINLLQPLLTIVSETLLEGIDVSIEFKNGFPKDVSINKEDLLQFYKSKEEYDIKIKRTSSGSHRADFNIKFNGIPATECASRGQLKLLAICLLLSQSSCISKKENGDGILLIDDLAAELDSSNKEKLLNYLSLLNKQLIITSTHDIKFSNKTSKVFHVKHGSISEIVSNNNPS